jgi:hypothetical protein
MEHVSLVYDQNSGETEVLHQDGTMTPIADMVSEDEIRKFREQMMDPEFRKKFYTEILSWVKRTLKS